MIRCISIIALLLLYTPDVGRAAEMIQGPVKARVLHVKDGDTLVVMARIWPGHDVQASVRIAGIDTPELKARCGAERHLAQQARLAVMDLVGQGRVTLHRIKRGKYFGRVIAEVYSRSGENLAEILLGRQLARPYHGTKRRSWCGESVL